MKAAVFIVVFFMFAFAKAQQTTIMGKVFDAATRTPLSGVGVYLSGTSTGVVTGQDGSYSIRYDEVMAAPLVFAYLGYDRIVVEKPLERDLKIVLLKEETNELEAVVIDPDPWDRATKERLFLDYFLGVRSLKDSKIKNLKDVRLRFNTATRQLIATSRKPILITNSFLGYDIQYDLIEFEINFNYLRGRNAPKQLFEIEHSRSNYSVLSSFISGNSFYQELENDKLRERTRERRRERAYKVSQLKFYRSLSRMQLDEDKFDLYYNGFRVKPIDHIRVRQQGEVYKVTFRHLKYTIVDRDSNRTDLYLNDHMVYFDTFGNNLVPRDLMASGYLPELGVGGMLPLDYGL